MSCLRAHRSALISLSLCVLTITSCRTASEPPPAEAPATNTVVSTTPPFQTKEPERYSATRTITIVGNNGETIVTKTLLARDGPLRREEQETAPVRVVYLELPEGRFILLPEQRVYAASVTGDAPAGLDAEAEPNSPDRLLHTDPISTTYQTLGAETVADRNTTKYRVVVNNTGSENVTLNETLMWIDDELNMPIKSETRSADGTRMTMELSDVSLDPDKQLFQIPAGHQKIAFGELQKQLKRSRMNP